MNEVERLLKDLRTGHACLMDVPMSTDIQMAAKEVRDWGRDQGMALSIVPVITESDQKLAIGPGAPWSE
jgi:hypothetical protein